MKAKKTQKVSKLTFDKYGNKQWKLSNGKLHREDGPAEEFGNGTKHWFINNECHREDGPAIELGNGNKYWFLNGNEYTEQEHKKRTLATSRRIKLEELLGQINKHWFINGKRHREDGPAVEFSNGDKHWYLNSELHREDGPAVEWASGKKEWYLYGKWHSEQEYKYKMRSIKLKELLK